MADLFALQKIAETDFADVVIGTRIVDAKLRVLFTTEAIWTSGGRLKSQVDSRITGSAAT